MKNTLILTGGLFALLGSCKPFGVNITVPKHHLRKPTVKTHHEVHYHIDSRNLTQVYAYLQPHINVALYNPFIMSSSSGAVITETVNKLDINAVMTELDIDGVRTKETRVLTVQQSGRLTEFMEIVVNNSDMASKRLTGSAAEKKEKREAKHPHLSDFEEWDLERRVAEKEEKQRKEKEEAKTRKGHKGQKGHNGHKKEQTSTWKSIPTDTPIITTSSLPYPSGSADYLEKRTSFINAQEAKVLDAKNLTAVSQKLITELLKLSWHDYSREMDEKCDFEDVDEDNFSEVEMMGLIYKADIDGKVISSWFPDQETAYFDDALEYFMKYYFCHPEQREELRKVGEKRQRIEDLHMLDNWVDYWDHELRNNHLDDDDKDKDDGEDTEAYDEYVHLTGSHNQWHSDRDIARQKNSVGFPITSKSWELFFLLRVGHRRNETQPFAYKHLSKGEIYDELRGVTENNRNQSSFDNTAPIYYTDEQNKLIESWVDDYSHLIAGNTREEKIARVKNILTQDPLLTRYNYQLHGYRRTKHHERSPYTNVDEERKMEYEMLIRPQELPSELAAVTHVILNHPENFTGPLSPEEKKKIWDFLGYMYFAVHEDDNHSAKKHRNDAIFPKKKLRKRDTEYQFTPEEVKSIEDWVDAHPKLVPGKTREKKIHTIEKWLRKHPEFIKKLHHNHKDGASQTSIKEKGMRLNRRDFPLGFTPEEDKAIEAWLEAHPGLPPGPHQDRIREAKTYLVNDPVMRQELDRHLPPPPAASHVKRTVSHSAHHESEVKQLEKLLEYHHIDEEDDHDDDDDYPHMTIPMLLNSTGIRTPADLEKRIAHFDPAYRSFLLPIIRQGLPPVAQPIGADGKPVGWYARAMLKDMYSIYNTLMDNHDLPRNADFTKERYFTWTRKYEKQFLGLLETVLKDEIGEIRKHSIEKKMKAAIIAAKKNAAAGVEFAFDQAMKQLRTYDQWIMGLNDHPPKNGLENRLQLPHIPR